VLRTYVLEASLKFKRPTAIFKIHTHINACSLQQDVSNVGRSSNNGGKVTAAGKPVVAKRTNGVKTRSMSNGGTVKEEAAVSLRGAIPEDRNPSEAVVKRSGRLLADPNSYQMTGDSDDIDERDKDDPLCATAYVADMYSYYREKETSTTPSPNFMDFQTHMNEAMRAILVDWLVEVHLKFKLVPETLYLTINLIDRYLEQEQVVRPKIQLVGVTCLLIASKYEEIYPPELRDLVYICDKAYDKNDVRVTLHAQVSMDCSTGSLTRSFCETDHRNGRASSKSTHVQNHHSKRARLLGSLSKGRTRRQKDRSIVVLPFGRNTSKLQPSSLSSFSTCGGRCFHCPPCRRTKWLEPDAALGFRLR
jgi:Cyclin, N-terminal domain